MQITLFITRDRCVVFWCLQQLTVNAWMPKWLNGVIKRYNCWSTIEMLISYSFGCLRLAFPLVSNDRSFERLSQSDLWEQMQRRCQLQLAWPWSAGFSMNVVSFYTYQALEWIYQNWIRNNPHSATQWKSTQVKMQLPSSLDVDVDERGQQSLIQTRKNSWLKWSPPI